MYIIFAAAPFVLPALGAAVASLNLPEGVAGAEESYSRSSYHNEESFLIARIPCNGCRAYAGASDEHGSEYAPYSSLETDLVRVLRFSFLSCIVRWPARPLGAQLERRQEPFGCSGWVFRGLSLYLVATGELNLSKIK